MTVGKPWVHDKASAPLYAKVLEIYLQENINKGTKFITLKEVNF